MNVSGRERESEISRATHLIHKLHALILLPHLYDLLGPTLLCNEPIEGDHQHHDADTCIEQVH